MRGWAKATRSLLRRTGEAASSVFKVAQEQEGKRAWILKQRRRSGLHFIAEIQGIRHRIQVQNPTEGWSYPDPPLHGVVLLPKRGG